MPVVCVHPSQLTCSLLTVNQERMRPSASRELYLQQFEELANELASPVPNFAATLITQAEEDANDENVSFLRMPTSRSHEDDSELASRLHLPPTFSSNIEHRRTWAETTAARGSAVEPQRRTRPAANRRFNPTQQLLDGASSSALSVMQDGLGYQGWAPGTSDNETEDSQTTLNNLRAIIHPSVPLAQES